MKLIQVKVAVEDKVYDEGMKAGAAEFMNQVKTGVAKQMASVIASKEDLYVIDFANNIETKQKDISANLVAMSIKDYGAIYSTLNALTTVDDKEIRDFALKAFLVLSNNGEVKWQKPTPPQAAKPEEKKAEPAPMKVVKKSATKKTNSRAKKVAK